MRTADLATSKLIDRIYDASTVEDAIFWREEFVRRLSDMIAIADVTDPLAGEEVALYATAKGQSEQVIARLQMALAKNEVFAWPSSTLWNPKAR